MVRRPPSSRAFPYGARRLGYSDLGVNCKREQPTQGRPELEIRGIDVVHERFASVRAATHGRRKRASATRDRL